MRNNNELNRKALLKYGFVAPLFAVMFILLSATINNSKAGNAITRKSSLDTVDNKGPIYTVVEIAPDFPGGETEFNNFLSRHIKYPKHAKENNISGSAFVYFVVEKDGSLSNIKIVGDPGYGLGKEAARVLALSPHWSPGIQNGSPIRVAYTVPIPFTLGNKPIVYDPAVMINRLINGTPDYPGNSNRLIILNGKEILRENLRKINPSDIKSVSIMAKGSGAIQKYGDKAKGGVVILTSKEPRNSYTQLN